MQLVETEVGNSKTIVMVWAKYLDEGRGDMAFLRRFFSEVNAIIVDVDVTRDLMDSTLQDINSEIIQVVNTMETLKPQVYVFARTSKSLSKETQKTGLSKIDQICAANNWKRFSIEENSQETDKIKVVANDLYNKGINPRKVNHGTYS